MKEALFFTTVSANCLLYLLGTTSNAVMGYLFFRRKKLKTRINSFIAHLSINSAVRSSFVVYSKIVNSLIGEKYLNYSICNLIAIIEVSTSTQFFSLLAALSYSILKRMACDRQLALVVADDLAILQHVVIFFGSLTLAAFGLESFGFEESRGTCGVRYNPGYSLFRIFMLAFKFLVSIFVFYVCSRVCKNDLENRNLIHPIAAEANFQRDNTVVSDTSHEETCAPIGTSRGKTDSATGVCSNVNTKSTELDSSDNSPCDSTLCDIGEAPYDDKQSFDSAKSNNIQSNVIYVNTRKTDDNDCLSNLDSPDPSTARPKWQSAKYKNPSRFDSDTESEISLNGRIVFSALPVDDGAGMEDVSVRETSFCLEVEDLRTGKTFKTIDINQISALSSAGRACNSKVNKKPNCLCAQHLKNYGPDNEFRESAGIESVFGTSDFKLESPTSSPEFIDNKEAAQEQRERNTFWRFARSVVLVLRRLIVRTKKLSNKVDVQTCYEQNECNLDEEGPGSLSLKSFDSEQYSRDVVACDFELRTRCGSEVHRTNSAVTSLPIVSQSTEEQVTQKDIRKSCCHENNSTSMTEYSSNSSQCDHFRDLHSTQYSVAPCNGCHGSEGVLGRSSTEDPCKAAKKCRTMVIFMISCLSIALSTPILSLQFLAVLGVWKGPKAIVGIADLVSDLNICLVPMVYANFCLDFRQEIFSFFIKKS